MATPLQMRRLRRESDARQALAWAAKEYCAKKLEPEVLDTEKGFVKMTVLVTCRKTHPKG